MLLLKPSAAADFLHLSKSTLAKMRITGRGPAFRKHGRSVVYEQAELERWSAQFIRANTSEYAYNPTIKVSANKIAWERAIHPNHLNHRVKENTG